MKLLLLEIFTIICGYFTLLGAAFTIVPVGNEKGPWFWCLLTLGTVLSAVALVATIIDYFVRRPKTMRSSRHINDYMFKWIQQGGKVAIFTRDMSWADERKVKDLLFSKA